MQVRCQAGGLRTAVVLHKLRGAACRRTAVASLYAGMGATATAVIGSSYLVSFYATKQLAILGMTELAERKDAQGAVQRTRGGQGVSAASATAGW